MLLVLEIHVPSVADGKGLFSGSWASVPSSGVLGWRVREYKQEVGITAGNSSLLSRPPPGGTRRDIQWCQPMVHRQIYQIAAFSKFPRASFSAVAQCCHLR